jgi:nucleotide-binding universal stress UspA family protein
MIKTILVAVDGSAHAKKAVKLASEIAIKCDARLIIVNVIKSAELPESLRDFTDVKSIKGPPPAVLRRAAGKVIDEARSRARGAGVSDVRTKVLKGSPERMIVDYARKKHADMIVMGSRGLGDVEGMLLGSISRSVGLLADCPCLTVK